jgi:hypothetical protein
LSVDSPQFKSPGTALIDMAKFVMNDSDEGEDVVRNLNVDQQRPAFPMKATRVLRRPEAQSSAANVVVASVARAAPLRAAPLRAAPARAAPVRAPAAPVLEHTRRALTVPIGASSGVVPRFMQSTATTRQRSNPQEQPVVKTESRRQMSHQAPAPTVQRRPAHVSNDYHASESRRNNQPAKPAQPKQHQENHINGRYHMTVPETPQWVRNSRAREKPKSLTTEEMEMREVAEKKRKLAEIAQRNRERLGMMQGVAQHESRYSRAASAFTPKKNNPKQSIRPQQQFQVTVPQAFNFATDRRR